MPQNAHIAASGGDYTNLRNWETGEQTSNYGAPTIGEVDGFFDQAALPLVISGSWSNGGGLIPFDNADAFDGTERQLCGLTSSQSNRTLRVRNSIPFTVDGLEIYNSGTGVNNRVLQTDTGIDTTLTNCLLRTAGDSIVLGAVLNNCVMVSSKTTNAADTVDGVVISNNSTWFCQTTVDVGSTATLTANDTVSVNVGSGDAFDALVTQSNTAADDATADVLDNIVVATEFLNSDPVLNGDYRIASGSDLDTNGIGAFIEATSGVTLLPTGIPSAESFGSAAIVVGGVSISPTGIVSAESFGSHTMTTGGVTVAPTGIATVESFGSHTLTVGGVSLLPSSITSAEVFGSHTVTLNDSFILPNGVASAESFGSHSVNAGELTIEPTSISSSETFGAVIIQEGGVTIFTSAIPSEEALGNPQLTYPQIVVVSGIGSEEIFGIAVVQNGVELVIPIGSRGTYQAMQRFLLSTGKFVSTQNNEIIIEWLKSEGSNGNQFNDLFIDYWNNKGFTGAYNDKWKQWKDS